MTTEEFKLSEGLSPFNLVQGENYFLESKQSKWYVTNNSKRGSLEKTGFSISVNSGYNSNNCYSQITCQFYMLGAAHAYSNMPFLKIRKLTKEEERWFNHCKALNKFIPYDKVILSKLRDFPDTGLCWKPTIELLKYLQKTRDFGHSLNEKSIENRGLVWTNNNIWTVTTSSSRPEYKIEDLLPFIKPENLTLVPLTPDECYFPEKWCIATSVSNADFLQIFMEERKHEWKKYNKSWRIGKDSFFHYPPISPNFPAHSDNVINEGYTLITTEQFLKHVLTHTDKNQIKQPLKQQENGIKQAGTSVTKVQRLNLTVRDTGSIRGIGIKCSKVQIKIGSGHLPN